MNFNVQNEYGKLKKVLISSIDTCPLLSGNLAKMQFDLSNGQAELIDILRKNNVDMDIIETEKNLGVLMGFARDPFFVVGNKLFVHKHADASKRKKARSVLMRQLGLKNDDNIVYIDSDARLDGGDVVVHNDNIYVGQNGFSSDRAGLEFAYKHLHNDFNIVPINLLKDIKGEPILHLDCVFNPLSKNEALFYPRGISRKAQREVLNNFDTVEITGEEQSYLGTNVLSIGNRNIISQVCQTRVNEKLKERGFNVSEINFGDTSALTGSVRCSTSPLERDK